MDNKKVKQILVTVGTTKFENLIQSIDQEKFYKLLDENEFTNLIIQKGTGDYVPTLFKSLQLKNLNVQVECLMPNFLNVIKSSDYIISHAGAGNLLEALQFNRKIFVVVNDVLMDNHQIELAEALSKDKYVYYIRQVDNVFTEVKDVLESEERREVKCKLNEYPKFNLDIIPNVIYDLLDV